jgi:hypothetical protein
LICMMMMVLLLVGKHLKGSVLNNATLVNETGHIVISLFSSSSFHDKKRSSKSSSCRLFG